MGYLKFVFKPIVHPLARLLAGLVAIPVFRLVRRRIVRTHEWDEEFEKDIDEWFRGSLLLLLATANFEWWVDTQILPSLLKFEFDLDKWWIAAGRIMLAVGVIETMPDQALFSIIHPGPPMPKYLREEGLWGSIRAQAWPILRGLACQYLNRSSPVFAIMSAIFGGNHIEHNTVGWVCYFLAITQSLIIGLVTSRDRALDVLSAFDREMAERRQDLIEEFHIDETKTSAPLRPDWMGATRSLKPPGEAEPMSDSE